MIVVPIAALLLTAVLYAVMGGGPVLAVLPWFNPLGFLFLVIASVLLTFLMRGRFQALHDPFSYWMSVCFASNSIGYAFYILAWPGLLLDGGALLARLPNTAAVIVTIVPTTFALFVLAALFSRHPSHADSTRHRVLGSLLWWGIASLLFYGAIIFFERYLPVMVNPDGSFTRLLLLWNSFSVLLLSLCAVLLVRHYRRTQDVFSALVYFPVAASVAANLFAVLGQDRYDLWWYLARVVIIAGYSVLLTGIIVQYIKIFQQLRDSESRYRQLTENLPQLIWTSAGDGSMTYFSPQWAEFTGVAVEQHPPTGVINFIHPDEQARVLDRWQASLASGVPFSEEFRLRRFDGAYFWFKGFALPIRDAQGSITEWFGSCTDIETLKQTTVSLQANGTALRDLTRTLSLEQERLKTVLENLPVGVWISDHTGRLVEKNEFADKIWAGNAPLVGSVADYPVYSAWFSDTGEPLKPEDYPASKTLLTGEPAAPVELRIRRFDGSEGYVIVSAAPIRDRNGHIQGTVSINLDISEAKQAEEINRRNEVQIQVQRWLIENREQQRQQLARELHDEPLQNLLTVAMLLAGLVDLPADQQNTKLAMIQDILLKTIKQVRFISFDLRPPVLLHLGLAQAMRSYIEVLKESFPQSEVSFVQQGVQPDLSETTLITLYRVFQELLVNTRKHARASQIDVTLRYTPDQIILEIDDDGVGFDPSIDPYALASSGHFGLVDVQERVKVVRGEIKIDTTPGKGTQILVVVPLNGQVAG